MRLIRLEPDREWIVDHSRRRYRVRPPMPYDHPAIDNRAVSRDLCIVLVRLRDRAKLVVSRICASVPWCEDSDGWAELRWRLANDARRRARLPVR